MNMLYPNFCSWYIIFLPFSFLGTPTGVLFLCCFWGGTRVRRIVCALDFKRENSFVKWRKRLLCSAKLHYKFTSICHLANDIKIHLIRNCAAQLSKAKRHLPFHFWKRPPACLRQAGGLSFCGFAAKTCAARHRQARFLIAEQSGWLTYKNSFRRIWLREKASSFMTMALAVTPQRKAGESDLKKRLNERAYFKYRQMLGQKYKINVKKLGQCCKRGSFRVL